MLYLGDIPLTYDYKGGCATAFLINVNGNNYLFPDFSAIASSSAVVS